MLHRIPICNPLLPRLDTSPRTHSLIATRHITNPNAACETFELRISAQVKANSFTLLSRIHQLTSQSTRLDQQLSIHVVATIATHGVMAALAPPLNSLNDDNDLPVSDVVDFTPFREVTVFEPSFKTWPNAIATRSVSLLKPSLHGDKFSDNTTAHAAVTVSVARQSTTASPHASHAVLWLGHQHYSTAKLTPSDYRR
jgi:hypothetical protein